uniref:Peptide-binding protein n=1 Tax=Melanopsichium pennsylvanicum 4 TaxID=1398559 RepID=A0A077R5H0_9BASI|nr:peptide-binding protein [Melanopsichium pennsylvanicum 4]
MSGLGSVSGPSTLPPGWTTHVSLKDGRTYYHNASTGKSTYTLPKPKREKPICKNAIPGANGWFKVATNKKNQHAPTEHADQDEQEDQDEEEWQRQLAEKMAIEAEAEIEAQAEVDTGTEVHTETNSGEFCQAEPQTCLENQRKAFMVHLSSLNGTSQEVNPMAPWDVEMAKFSTHPSFVMLWSSSSKSNTEDVFNEWCKLRIREKRNAKATASTFSSSSSCFSTTNTTVTADSNCSWKQNLVNLLKKEVKSTRTKFDDFLRAFASHPDLIGFSRSDGEKVFNSDKIKMIKFELTFNQPLKQIE